MSPSPRPRHTKVLDEVLRQLHIHEHVSSGLIDIYFETDLYIDDHTVYRPDLSVYARPRPQRIPERLNTPPDLILEVLSPGSKPLDLITKRDAYEKFGVREYWTIDPDDGRLRAWARERDRFREVLSEGNALPSTAISGFALNIAPIVALAGTPEP